VEICETFSGSVNELMFEETKWKLLFLRRLVHTKNDLQTCLASCVHKSLWPVLQVQTLISICVRSVL